MSASATRRLIAGVGNAGVSILDLMALEEPGFRGIVAVNNDPESLASTVVREKIEVPPGDPSDGFLAIDGEFGKLVEGAASLVLCGGLGGETSSFLIPALAILAKSSGITVAACVSLPFGFEGKRKTELAGQALEKLHAVCDAVAVISNERLSGGSPATAAVGEAFVLADRTLLACTRALHGMLSTGGPVRITRADLNSVLGVPGALTVFGSGTSVGGNRLHEALEGALSSPLMRRQGKTTPGSALLGARTVLLLLQGPADLSFAEVQAAVAGIERLAGDRCQIKTGVLATMPPGSPLTISVIASSGGESAPSGSRRTDAERAPAEKTKPDGASERVPETIPPNPVQTLRDVRKRPATTAKQTQGTLDLDNYQKGRFDKSQPTIVAGEDLDIPTFLRKGIKLSQPRRN
jgi:cell division protein FtsZ